MPDIALSEPGQLALRIARADLGYIAAALGGGHVERALTFRPHAVLVAFEAHGFCTRQLGLSLPALSWDDEVAAAARTSGKLFDDTKRDLDALISEVGQIAAATRTAFRGGPERRLARMLGIANPDLSVLSLGGVPVMTNITMGFHSAGQIAAPGHDDTGRVAFDLAYAIGQMAAHFGLAHEQHDAPAADRDQEWTWADGDAEECSRQAFGGQVSPTVVPLLIVLQTAATTAAKLAFSVCCDGCRFAAFKHRLVVAHHLARSLAVLRTTGAAGAVVTDYSRALLEDVDIDRVFQLRALRNGLLHLGLSDAPASAFASTDPAGALVEHYAGGQPYSDIDATVQRALKTISELLTNWLLTAPPGGLALTAVLRPPKD